MALTDIFPHSGSATGRFGARYFATKIKFDKDVWLTRLFWYNNNSSNASIVCAPRIYRASDNALQGGFQSSVTVALKSTPSWYGIGLVTPVKLDANTDYWVGLYFSTNAGSITLSFTDQSTGGNPLPHTHVASPATMTISGGGNATSDTYPPATSSGSADGPEPTYEYAIGVTVTDQGFMGLHAAGTGEAGVFSLETWTAQISVDKTVKVTGLNWFAKDIYNGNATVTPRIYRSSDGVLVGSGNAKVISRSANMGWETVIPLDIQTAILDPNVNYDIGFYFGSPGTAAKPSMNTASVPHTHVITHKGVTYTFTYKGRRAISGDVIPTAPVDTSYEIAYGLEFIPGDIIGDGSGIAKVTTTAQGSVDFTGSSAVIAAVVTSATGILEKIGMSNSATAQLTASGTGKLDVGGSGSATAKVVAAADPGGIVTGTGSATAKATTTASGGITTTSTGSSQTAVIALATPLVEIGGNGSGNLVVIATGSGSVGLAKPKYSRIDIYDLSYRRVASLSPASDGVFKAELEEELNGTLKFTFELPLPNSKAQYINNSNYILRLGSDYEFTPDIVEDGRDDDNRTTLKAKYQGNYVELGQSFDGIVLDFRVRGFAFDALTAILAGTSWTVGIVDVPVAERRLITELESRLGLLQKARELWGGDLVFDTVNKVVHLRQRYGQAKNIHIRYQKNLTSVKRITDLNIITRLYPFGEGSGETHTRHNISAINGGKLYVDNFTYSTRILEGTYVNTDFDDPTELKAQAQSVLEYYCKPRVTYQCDFIDLSRMVGHEIEFVGLGDELRVLDDDLNFDFIVRTVRKKWDIFVPEQAELELSNVRNDISDDFSKFIRAGKIVDQTMNPGGYLPTGFFQGFINAATNEIRSANSRLRWTNGDIFAEEINPVTQVPTGRVVRINSGGIAISNDGGQTFTTAMTGSGIIADVITTGILNVGLVNIVNSTGSMKILGNGLEIWDVITNPARKRVHLGEYTPGKFGLQVIAQDGATTLVDEQGILQTWQIQDADNVAVNFPLSLKTYIPGDTISIRKAILNFSLEPFRAYSTGASSGGGSTQTSTSGGGTTVTSSSGGSTTITSSSGGGTTSTTFASGYWTYDLFVPDATNTIADHTHTINSVGTHNHGITGGTWVAVSSNGSSVTGYVGWVESGSHTHTMGGAGAHDHSLEANHKHDVTIPSHTHTVTIPNHTHTVTIPDHTHNVSIPAHTHGMVYGIFESTPATGVKVTINGIDRTVALGGGAGGFTLDVTNLNITQYMAIGNWNTIQLSSTQLGRINAVLFIQAFMEVS